MRVSAAFRRCAANKKTAGKKSDRRSTTNRKAVWLKSFLCKFKGIYWSGVSRISAPDAGVYEVRWTHHYETGGLIVYHTDADGSRFTLMDGVGMTKRIIGWLFGHEAKKMAVTKDFGDVVPRDKLRKIYA